MFSVESVGLGTKDHCAGEGLQQFTGQGGQCNGGVAIVAPT